MSKRYPGGIIRKTPQTPSQTSAQGVWDMTSVTQAVKENTWPIAGVPDPLSRSLRFRSSASASLSRTPASASNRTTWTWSGWVKRAEITTTERTFFSAGTDGNNFTALAWNNDKLFFQNYTSGSQVTATTTAVYRDPSAWYHIVLAIDTTQGTAANRAKIYVNGVQQDGFNGSSFSSSQQFWINFTYTHRIGSRQLSSADSFSEQYLTEVYFIDGQALTPSSFGTTDDQTGVWEPIAYTGTYGTNGFYLPFSNTASTSTLGNDFSGNSNNWTTNNISLTSGSTYDSMVDVPTQWIPYNTAGDTGALFRGNYCVLNPLDKNASSITISNGNLQYATSSTNFGVRATVAVSSGKWYWEANMTTVTNVPIIGIADATWALTWVGVNAGSYGYGSGGAKYNNGGAVAYGASFTTNDVIGIALDLDAGTLTFYKNNVSQGTAYSSLSGTFFPACSGQTSDTVNMNFGQRPFSYTPPSGFKSLCTTNLPTPTIGATASTQANKYFDATTFTGNASTNVITNSGSMQPDMVWLKSRSNANNHTLYDSLRGVNTLLYPNLTNAEAVGTNQLTSFNSNGFTLGASENANDVNGESSVGWQWRASNATAVTNTAGSITSTVSANTSAGFSIVTYTGNGTQPSTVGHGLGVAPSMYIIKTRNSALYDWNSYHISLGNTQYIALNTTAAASSAVSLWNNTSPTSTVFTINHVAVNTSSNTYVAYCFAPVAGYSAFGSYTGNGSNDGPFIYTGFRPKWLLIKNSSQANTWFLMDTTRSPYNEVNLYLHPDTSSAEVTYAWVDILSNGFKIRNTGTGLNNNGIVQIYAAFAESPFKYALAR